MVNAALPTSTTLGGIRPPSMKTLATSGRRRRRSAMVSVTASVSINCEPGGSSTASSDREVSEAGRKPDGRRRVPAIAKANTAKPRAMVMNPCRIDQARTRL